MVRIFTWLIVASFAFILLLLWLWPQGRRTKVEERRRRNAQMRPRQIKNITPR